jgi:hypothetical protein
MKRLLTASRSFQLDDISLQKIKKIALNDCHVARLTKQENASASVLKLTTQDRAFHHCVTYASGEITDGQLPIADNDSLVFRVAFDFNDSSPNLFLDQADVIPRLDVVTVVDQDASVLGWPSRNHEDVAAAPSRHAHAVLVLEEESFAGSGVAKVVFLNR